jgi:predicted Mrr-cat superfamily restriction endonuclease
MPQDLPHQQEDSRKRHPDEQTGEQFAPWRGLIRTLPDKPAKAIALFVGYWTRFLWEAKPGDLIVLPLRDRSVAIGELTGPYHYVAARDARARHRRSVAWNAFPARDAFNAELAKLLNSQHSVQEFKSAHAVPELEDVMAVDQTA